MSHDRRCVRCERLLFFWHPVDKPLCTTCAPSQGAAARPKLKPTDKNAHRRAFLARRVEARQCVRCAKPVAEGHRSMCEEHRSAHCAYMRKAAARRRNGLCTLCGRPKPAASASKPRCPVCTR
jgi:hypothetical protein